MNREEFDAVRTNVHAALEKMSLPPDAKVVLGLIAEIVLSVARTGAGKTQRPADCACEPPRARTEDAVPQAAPQAPEVHRKDSLSLHHREPRPLGPMIAEELARESRRASDNIGEVVDLVMQVGAPPEPVCAAVHEYLVQHVALEQRLVQSLLDIPRGRPAPSKGRASRRTGEAS